MISVNYSHECSFAVGIPTNCYLSARRPLKGTITFDSQSHRGRFQDRLELIFYDATSQKQFAIVKSLLVIVGDADDYETLKPVAPYVSKRKKQRDPVHDVEPGERPPALAEIEWTVKLPKHEIPKSLQIILGMPTVKEKIRLIRSGFIPRQFSPETHARLFHILLHIEEHQSSYELLLLM